MIRIEFQIDSGTHTLSDTLELDDNHGLSDAEIEALKQARLDAVIAKFESDG